MRLLFIVIMVLLNTSGCSLSTASSIEDYKRAKKAAEEKNLEAKSLENEYLNADTQTIASVLGRPKQVQKELSPYLVDANCHGSKCETRLADEVWIYEFRDRGQRGRHFYTLIIYFANNKVVRIH